MEKQMRYGGAARALFRATDQSRSTGEYVLLLTYIFSSSLTADNDSSSVDSSSTERMTDLVAPGLKDQDSDGDETSEADGDNVSLDDEGEGDSLDDEESRSVESGSTGSLVDFIAPDWVLEDWEGCEAVDEDGDYEDDSEGDDDDDSEGDDDDDSEGDDGHEDNDGHEDDGHGDDGHEDDGHEGYGHDDGRHEDGGHEDYGHEDGGHEDEPEHEPEHLPNDGHHGSRHNRDNTDAACKHACLLGISDGLSSCPPPSCPPPPVSFLHDTVSFLETLTCNLQMPAETGDKTTRAALYHHPTHYCCKRQVTRAIRNPALQRAGGTLVTVHHNSADSDASPLSPNWRRKRRRMRRSPHV